MNQNFQDKSQLLNNISYKYARTFTYNSNKIEDTFHFGRNLALNPDFIYTLKLNGFYGWENLINITNENNVFRYSPDSGSTWKNIVIPQGIWNFNDIDNNIKSVMKLNGDYKNSPEEYYINFTIHKNKYKAVLSITKNTYIVDFNINNSIAPVYGFVKNSNFAIGSHEAPNIPNIAPTQIFFIVIDLIEPNILQTKNGNTKSLQYVRSIKPFVKNIGDSIIVEDSSPIKYKLLESVYNTDHCKISLLDEDMNPIKTMNDEFTIVFTIQSA